ncbi:MAG TPA: YfhO family protein [Bryobacteraceae bacterium]|nr:YfhO family protein [Bryobacteraceae bacterium]
METKSTPKKLAPPDTRSRLRDRVTPPLLTVLGVITVFWKLALTKQYTFLASPDQANQVMPWLQTQVWAIRHWFVMLWDPYEWMGQSLIGQVQPGVASPFTFLLALAPLHHGQIQIFYVHLWFVLIHCVAALFAYWFLRDQGCSAGASVLGGIFYATAGFCGNTEWPQHLAAGIWAPLVFLFLLRALRGRTPMKSAAWAGVSLGLAWLSGHHAPALAITLAVVGVGMAALVRSEFRRQTALRLAVMFAVMAMVAAVQSLPAAEYGKLAKRWTVTGALTWKDKVEIPEHEDSGLRPNDLLHIVMPASALRTDPFVGVVGLSLAALAVFGGMRRRGARMFLLMAICALLFAMARNDAFYGWFYVFVPFVEKSRAPIVALCVFQFAMAVLVAMGADILIAAPEQPDLRKVLKALSWFGGITFGLFMLMAYLRPSVTSGILDGDPRPGMIGLIALLLAGLYTAWSRGYLRAGSTLAMLCLLLVIEQGNEAGWNWAHVRDQNRMGPVTALYDTQDLADWLRTRPGPKRLEINDKDTPFSFGDWYRMDAAHAFTASMLTATSELGGWWVDRIGRMYGLNYVVSRTPTRPGLQEMFTGKTGIKIWYNPEAFPRAWTVHRIVVAPNEWNGADMMNTWTFDLRTTALTVRAKPQLDTCGGADQVTRIDEKPSSVRVDVRMACKGLLVVSDNWYPGWHASIDGNSADIWKVNTVVRGVVVGTGKHTITMTYRPFSVYFGLFCTLLGVAVAIILQRKREEDAADVIG